MLEKGEGLEIEFKESYLQLNKDTFESICAFLNRKGGHLILGVTNGGKVEGVLEDEVDNMIQQIVTNANNPQKLHPVFYFAPEVVDYDGKKLIYVWVPQSSQVHQTAGKIFDRNQDGDFDITHHQHLVQALHLRKQQSYTENRIYPALKFTDFRSELFDKIRKLARSQRPDHSWLSLDDMELMRSAGLYQKDYQSGQEGFTLAAVLLLGKDEIIQSVLPHYRTDAIYRVIQTDRYDDRDDIRTNLVEAYERLMSFIAKHLPEKFFQEGTQRVNLRDKLFHEVVANLLVHREYANAFPAKLVIEREQVSTENWNKPHGHGMIDPGGFTPFPKNPIIARFFKEIGRVEELGSGVRNIFKYGKIYSGGRTPELLENDVFRTIIPILPTPTLQELPDVNGSNQDSNQDGNQDGNQEKNIPFLVRTPSKILEALQGFLASPSHTQEQLEKLRPFLDARNEYWLPVLEFAQTPKTKREILEHIGLSNQTKNFKNIVTPLIEYSLVTAIIKDRPTSKYQKYLTTNKGRMMIQLLKEIDKK